MTIAARSAFLFQLAAEFGLPTAPGAAEPVEDSTFLEFSEAYLTWSASRDQALAQHLRSTPTLFRVYVPYSERVFHLASQVVWYLDEIIVRDPLILFLSDTKTPTERRKLDTISVLQFLSAFRDPLSNGYILLGGRSLISSIPEEMSPDVDHLMMDPAVVEALHSATRCGFDLRRDSRGVLVPLYSLMLDSGGCYGWEFPGVERGQRLLSPLIRIGERLPSISADELRKRLKSDPFFQMEDTFRREIFRTLFAVEQARELSSAVLFDRDLDQVLLLKSASSVDQKRQAATVAVLNLMLPYIKGIPPGNLSAVREEAPEAFIDFRNRMNQLVRKAIAEGCQQLEEIGQQVEGEIIPQLRSLDAGISAAIRKARIQGLGVPLVSAVASLGGAVLGAPPTATVGAAAAGSIAAITAAGELASKEEEAKGHPFYFLWKAKRGGRAPA